MNTRAIPSALLAAAISVAIGLGITFGVSKLVPTSNLPWSLIAVGFASFFAAFAGHMGGAGKNKA